MYKAALDVHYSTAGAKAVCLLFENWTDAEPIAIYLQTIMEVEAYEPGQFYKRELPCLLQVLAAVDLSKIEVMIVDGYVYLDENGTYGLGAHLYTALRKAIPVIGVAKTKFYDSPKNVVPLKRGNSSRPLYITAIEIEVETAAQQIKAMSGSYRMPKLLKLLDQLTKTG